MGELQGATTTTTSRDRLQPACRPDDSCGNERASSVTEASAHEGKCRSYICTVDLEFL